MRIFGQSFLANGLLVSVLMFGADASAAIFLFEGKVKTVLATDENYGNCMVELTGYSAPSGCKATWISLDCTNDFIKRSTSSNFLDAVNMAAALNNTVKVWVNNQQRHNGWCVANRVDQVFPVE